MHFVKNISAKRQMAGAAVLLEEWLQELAALAQVNLNLVYSSNFVIIFPLIGAQCLTPAGASSGSMM